MSDGDHSWEEWRTRSSERWRNVSLSSEEIQFLSRSSFRSFQRPANVSWSTCDISLPQSSSSRSWGAARKNDVGMRLMRFAQRCSDTSRSMPASRPSGSDCIAHAPSWSSRRWSSRPSNALTLSLSPTGLKFKLIFNTYTLTNAYQKICAENQTQQKPKKT